MASACGAVAVVSGFQNLRQACILSSPGTLRLFFLTPGELVLNGLLAWPPPGFFMVGLSTGVS
jgi:hypothetical protein